MRDLCEAAAMIDGQPLTEAPTEHLRSLETALSQVVLAVHRVLHPRSWYHGPDHWARVRAHGLEL